MKIPRSSGRGKPSENYLSWACGLGNHESCFYSKWFKVPPSGCRCICHRKVKP